MFPAASRSSVLVIDDSGVNREPLPEQSGGRGRICKTFSDNSPEINSHVGKKVLRGETAEIKPIVSD